MLAACAVRIQINTLLSWISFVRYKLTGILDSVNQGKLFAQYALCNTVRHLLNKSNDV